jgi:BlaI family penicillinase repressor
MTRLTKAKPKRPTDLELAILRVLWKQGPLSVRDVLQHFNKEREHEAGYTTILKMLQIMAEKGLVQRDDSVRPQIYSPALSEHETQGQMINDLMDRAFGGSARELVMRALSAKKTPERDLREIEKLLDRVEKGGK